tara:strand:- start:353 stop:541 length:189 start_codon:yes stop_codon:yes gene_type:complete
MSEHVTEITIKNVLMGVVAILTSPVWATLMCLGLFIFAIMKLVCMLGECLLVLIPKSMGGLR